MECGNETGYLHWQLLLAFKKKITLRGVKELFGNGIHAEPSRSDAALAYVWKEDTAVQGTRFELGRLAIKRNCAKDWDLIWEDAKRGKIESIPGDIRIRSYSALRRIEADFMAPEAFEKSVYVFWGRTGTGKSRRAWTEAGVDAYPKDPRSKFWDGYRGHEHVVIDEFRGGIDISHMLRWLDRYPTIVEIKGGSVVFKARKIWITSNLDPRCWYPQLDEETKNALLRRMEVVHFDGFN